MFIEIPATRLSKFTSVSVDELREQLQELEVEFTWHRERYVQLRIDQVPLAEILEKYEIVDGLRGITLARDILSMRMVLLTFVKNHPHSQRAARILDYFGGRRSDIEFAMDCPMSELQREILFLTEAVAKRLCEFSHVPDADVLDFVLEGETYDYLLNMKNAFRDA